MHRLDTCVPPTLVASIYGMNFRQMAELGRAWGHRACHDRAQCTPTIAVAQTASMVLMHKKCNETPPGSGAFRAVFLQAFTALGWRGSARHWRNQRTVYAIMSAIMAPMVISVHSVVGLDYAGGLKLPVGRNKRIDFAMEKAEVADQYIVAEPAEASEDIARIRLTLFSLTRNQRRP
jgi:hypothetical protein